jgi:pseudouridine synthase
MPRIEPSTAHAGETRARERSASDAAVRLQKVLAAAGVASRRVAEQLIVDGRVTVDGRVVTQLGTRIDPARAVVQVDGERVSVRPDRAYYIVHKPAGVITTAADPAGRPIVTDLVRARGRRLYPVGRLDADTTGVLLLTDDGELAHRLMHPRFGIERIYVAKVGGEMGAAALARLTAGVHLEDGLARAVRARIRNVSRRASQVELVMTEGRKREVRRLLEAVGHPVIELARVGFGPIRLGRLAPGESRPLTAAEIGSLLKIVGL